MPLVIPRPRETKPKSSATIDFAIEAIHRGMARTDALIDAGECVQEIEGAARLIPIQQFHNGGAHEAAIDAAFDEITGNLGRRSGSPKADMDKPMPTIITGKRLRTGWFTKRD